MSSVGLHAALFKLLTEKKISSASGLQVSSTQMTRALTVTHLTILQSAGNTLVHAPFGTTELPHPIGAELLKRSSLLTAEPR